VFGAFTIIQLGTVHFYNIDSVLHMVVRTQFVVAFFDRIM